jgi:hypothetical protein
LKPLCGQPIFQKVFQELLSSLGKCRIISIAGLPSAFEVVHRADDFHLPLLLVPVVPLNQFEIGCNVELASDFASYSDAASGPLKLADQGTVSKVSSRVQVSFGGRSWWYDKAALKCVSSVSSRSSEPSSSANPSILAEQVAFSSSDNLHVLLDFLTQEIMRATSKCSYDAQNLIPWFDEAEDACAKLIGKQTQGEHHIVSSMRFAAIRNALLSSTLKSEDAAVQLLPSMLRLCEAAASGNIDNASSEFINACLLFDIVSTTSQIEEIKASIAGYIKQRFIQGNLDLTLKLCAGLLASCRTALSRLSVNQRATATQSSKDEARSALAISGATGPCAQKINGTFYASDMSSCGQTVYLKRADPDVCILFSSESKCWTVTNKNQIGKQHVAGWAHVIHESSLEAASSLNTFKVAAGGAWTDQPSIRIERVDDEIVQSRLITDADSHVLLYKEHGQFIRRVVYCELLSLLETLATVEIEQALGASLDQDKLASILPEMFTDQPEFCKQMSIWAARMINQCRDSVLSNNIYNFVATLCGICSSSCKSLRDIEAVGSGLEKDDKGESVSAANEACDCRQHNELNYAGEDNEQSFNMQFLQQLHISLFLQSGEATVNSWSACSSCIDRALLSHGAVFSKSLSDMLFSIRSKTTAQLLHHISEQHRSCLIESIMGALFSLSEAFKPTASQSLCESKSLESCVDVLLPWTSVMSGLSFDYPIKASIAQRAG